MVILYHTTYKEYGYKARGKNPFFVKRLHCWETLSLCDKISKYFKVLQILCQVCKLDYQVREISECTEESDPMMI